MVVSQLITSSFFGGPERQILGLCIHLPEPFRNAPLLFDEAGRQRALLQAAHISAPAAGRITDSDHPGTAIHQAGLIAKLAPSNSSQPSSSWRIARVLAAVPSLR